MDKKSSNAVRIASNFARLFLTFAVGIFVVRLLLRFGNDAYGLIALLGAGTGLAVVFKQVVRFATVPVLGEAFHSDKKGWFSEVYNSALACSGGAALATIGVFGIFAACLPLLDFPPELFNAAILFVLCGAVQTFFTVALAPIVNFYVVCERMVAYNAIILFERVGELAAALLTILWFDSDTNTMASAASAIVSYGILNAVFSVMINFVAVYRIVRTDHRLTLQPGLISRQAVSTFLRSASWNGVVVVTMNLYARADVIIMNLSFGLFGSTVFSLANQCVCYLRNFIIGLVTGMDAVASRISRSGGDAALVSLMSRTTRFQAIFVFPAVCLIFVLADPLLELWLKGRLENPDTTIPAISWLVRILVVGLGARCLSEGWISIMNGAGKVNKYAPVILVGGILNPILASLTLVGFPATQRFAGPACVFSALLVIVHLVALPTVVAREFHVSFRDVLRPIIRPAIAAGTCALLAVLIAWTIDKRFSATFTASFIGLYGISTFAVLLSPLDRKRIVGLVCRGWPRVSSKEPG